MFLRSKEPSAILAPPELNLHDYLTENPQGRAFIPSTQSQGLK